MITLDTVAPPLPSLSITGELADGSAAEGLSATREVTLNVLAAGAAGMVVSRGGAFGGGAAVAVVQSLDHLLGFQDLRGPPRLSHFSAFSFPATQDHWTD